MAKKNTVVVTDDLDGSTLSEGEAETITFTYGGQSYEIDLSRDNAKKLDDALAPFIDAARKVRTSTATNRPARVKGSRDLNAIRQWATQNGHTVAERGRVSQSVIDAYDAAN